MSGIKSRRGFTLVEMMVVITVTAVLSGLMITFGETSKAQISLLKEGAKVVQVVSRAKALSLESKSFNPGTGNAFCGYGVKAVDNKTYQIFILILKNGNKSDCAEENFGGKISEEIDFKEYALSAGIKFSDDSKRKEVFFIPPRPYVKFFESGIETEDNSLNFEIQSETGGLSRIIKINSVGQVSITN